MAAALPSSETASPDTSRTAASSGSDQAGVPSAPVEAKPRAMAAPACPAPSASASTTTVSTAPAPPASAWRAMATRNPVALSAAAAYTQVGVPDAELILYTSSSTGHVSRPDVAVAKVGAAPGPCSDMPAEVNVESGCDWCHSNDADGAADDSASAHRARNWRMVAMSE